MTQILESCEPGFADAFAELAKDRRESERHIQSEVRDIIDNVRRRGCAAVAEYTARFDNYQLGTDDDGWRIDAGQCRSAYEAIDRDLREALNLAANRIRQYHERQLPANTDYHDDSGMRLGARWRAISAAGIYVPGGRASYPSSLLMNAIPARIAGVERIAVVTPTPAGKLNPVVLAAAHIAQIDEIWRIGGAQSIAALAYGTENIAAVEMIAGPGNAYVAEAKRQLFGVVGIDMVAGPSELLVIADGDNDANWIAADLLSQAEHDTSAQSILITDSPNLARRVQEAIAAQLETLTTADTARQSWEQHGAIITVDNIGEAPALANILAAEHVELAVADPEAMFDQIRNAGSVFLGAHSCEALGDYVAGPNHVLPTGRTARFTSGLSVLDFMKRTSFIEASADGVRAIGPAAIAIAQAEGLPAHAASVARRLTKAAS